jgi:APA family basic amino acid/polyamine antiporter
VAGLTIHYAQLLGIALIILLTYINTRGVKTGKIIQTIFTSTKLIAMFALIVAGLFFFNSDIWNANWENAWTIQSLTKSSEGAISTTNLLTGAAMGAIASAMVGSIFSSDAWNNVTFIAGEIQNPKRNIGLSLFLGTLIVTVIYILMNVVYLANVNVNDLAFAKDNRVALSASDAIFGSIGTVLIALLIMISTFGCNNGLILAGARVYYTMAKDQLFFKNAGELNANAVPEWALWIQCAMASALCLSGKYGDLLDMVSFVVVIFYVLTIAGIFILRKKLPDVERPYKAFGYPVLPIIYIIMGLSFCGLLIIYKPQFTWPGLIITLIGIPLYFIAVRSGKSKSNNIQQ